MVKAAELKGADLDGMAAIASRIPGHIETYSNGQMIIERYFLRTDERRRFSPSTNWADGGPIIEHGRIALRHRLNMQSPGEDWEAGIGPDRFDWGDGHVPDAEFTCTGPTPLIAAMRAYVTAKYGAEFE